MEDIAMGGSWVVTNVGPLKSHFLSLGEQFSCGLAPVSFTCVDHLSVVIASSPSPSCTFLCHVYTRQILEWLLGK